VELLKELTGLMTLFSIVWSVHYYCFKEGEKKVRNDLNKEDPRCAVKSIKENSVGEKKKKTLQKNLNGLHLGKQCKLDLNSFVYRVASSGFCIHLFPLTILISLSSALILGALYK
jgi:hypothetical protein